MFEYYPRSAKDPRAHADYEVSRQGKSKARFKKDILYTLLTGTVQDYKTTVSFSRCESALLFIRLVPYGTVVLHKRSSKKVMHLGIFSMNFSNIYRSAMYLPVG